MILADCRNATSVNINGVGYTNLNGLLFLGSGLNNVLLNIIAHALRDCQVLALYEGYWNDGKLHLLNGVSTKPVMVGVVTDENGVVHISDGYISNRRKVIDWNLVGAVAYQDKIIWTHPRLSVNLRLVQNNQISNNKRVSKTDKLPFKHLKDFKDYLQTGREFRVVDWSGKRNRRNFRLVVTQVVKTKGFNVDVFFGNRKVGADFIEFLPANCYEFKSGGIISTVNPQTNDLFYVLEPLDN